MGLIDKVLDKVGFARKAPAVVKSSGSGARGSFIPWNIVPPDIMGTPNELKQPYAESVWVHRAIDLVAGPIASVPLMFSNEEDELLTASVRGIPRAHRRERTTRQIRRAAFDSRGKAPVEGGTPNERLAEFWDFPGLNRDGSRMSRAEFIHASTGWHKLKGEIFYILDDSWILPFPEVRDLGGYTPIIIARPDRMKHIVTNGELVRWEYTVAGKTLLLSKEQVIRVTHWNPYDDWRGLGEMDSCSVVAQSDYAAGIFAKNLNDNNGDQGVMIVAKTGIPDEAQRDMIVRQLREKRELQQRGIYRPIFLSGDLTVEDPHLRAVDAAFNEQRRENRKEIAAGFGVPASFFDPQASYSVGAASDRYVLIEETCMPMGEELCGAYSEIASRQSGQRVNAWLQWGDHSVMQQVREGRMDNATKLWDRGWAWEDISDYLSLEAPKIEGGEIGYIPISMVPVGSPEAQMGGGGDNPVDNQDYSENPADNSTGEKPPKEVQQMLHALECRAHPKKKKKRSKKNERLWRAHMQKRLPFVKSYMSRFNRELMKARAEVLRNLEQFAATKSQGLAGGRPSVFKASLIDILFDRKRFGEALAAVFKGVTASAMNEAGNQVFEEIGVDRSEDPWKMPPPQAIAEIRRQEKRMEGVSETVWGHIKGDLEEGYKEGEGIDDLSDRVRAQCNAMSKYEAKRVAMTETQSVFGFARQEAMKAAGVEYKSWLSSHGPNVREAHLAAEEQYGENPIPTEEAFKVGGEDLDYPGDPSGSPENVINCQCISLAVPPPKKDSTEANEDNEE